MLLVHPVLRADLGRVRLDRAPRARDLSRLRLIVVAGSASGITVSGLAATVSISGSEAANDQLTINALAGDDTRRRKALADMLEPIDRLDALVSELLAMTQRSEPHPVSVELQPFLAVRVETHRAEADAREVAVRPRAA